MKKAFVSGGTRGIGRSVAELLLSRGYEVGIGYCDSQQIAEDMVKTFPQRLHLFPADLSRTGAGSELSQRILEEMGEIDLLVNNAGVSHYGVIQEVNELDFERVFSTNFKSMFFLTQGLLSPMIQKGNGSIINLSSVWGQSGASCEVLYSSSKAAIIGFTKALAKELAPCGIRVNCIAPGVVDTEMMNRFSDTEKEALLQEIPMGRFTLAQEIANTVLFLDQEAPATLTGQVIAVNGGLYC